MLKEARIILTRYVPAPKQQKVRHHSAHNSAEKHKENPSVSMQDASQVPPVIKKARVKLPRYISTMKSSAQPVDQLSNKLTEDRRTLNEVPSMLIAPHVMQARVVAPRYTWLPSTLAHLPPSNPLMEEQKSYNLPIYSNANISKCTTNAGIKTARVMLPRYMPSFTKPTIQSPPNVTVGPRNEVPLPHGGIPGPQKAPMPAGGIPGPQKAPMPAFTGERQIRPLSIPAHILQAIQPSPQAAQVKVLQQPLDPVVPPAYVLSAPPQDSLMMPPAAFENPRSIEDVQGKREILHMIMSFRVSELQVLLGFAGRNKSGRKQELLQRALQLVQKGCTMPVQVKIRELYRQIFSTSLQRRRYPSGPGESPPQNRAQADIHPSVPSMGSCPIDFSTKHIPTSIPEPTPSGLPVHPDVRCKHLPFYDVLGELMKPTSLVPKNNGRFQESFFVFHLTPQQAQDIAMSRDFRAGAKCEYTVQVQLRFCLLETSCEQEDNFPPNICVRVNGKMAPLPNPIPTSKPGVEPKRPGRPVDITSICRLSPTVSNQLDVSWASEFGRGYCFSIYLVRRLTSDTLLQRLKQFGNRHPDHTRALIKEKLAHDPESEIATTSLRVSLLCPLGKMRMQIPCRSSTCSHLQCFDAITFLMMNEKKPTWLCPVCDKPAPFDKLLVDGYFIEIFRKNPEFHEIQFHEDGTWSPMKHNKETVVISSPSVKKPSVQVSSNSLTSRTKSRKKSDTVIDLTCDSSDEDVPPSPASVSSRQSEPGCVSPPVINLDTPTPPHPSSTHSLSSSPASVAHSISQSNPQSPHRASPLHSPLHSPSPNSVASFSSVDSTTTVPSTLSFMPAAPPPPVTATLPPMSAIPNMPILNQPNPPFPPPMPPTSMMYPIPTHPPPLTMPSTSSMLPSISVPPAMLASPIAPPPPPPNQYGTLNLDALSDREFEEFLQGLSW